MGRSEILFFFSIFLSILLISFVRADPSWSGNNLVYNVTEDITYYHNLTNNISNPVSGMTFAIDTIQTNITWDGNLVNYSTISPWIFIDISSNELLVINASLTNQTGNFVIPLKVTYSGGASTSYFNFSIAQVNDAPNFVNLENKSFNITELFSYRINVTDEENDIPFTFNISFVDCVVAPWSTRNCSNATGRELFTPLEYTTNNTAAWINISFTPNRNDVGNYTINFTVTDLNNTVQPYNATRSQLVLFQVLNQNVPPYFTYVCDNERNGVENSSFNCRINFTDIDEINNITITANYSFFKFNESGTNSAIIPVNFTTEFNGSAVVNFTPDDYAVGNWSVNISLTDNSDIPIKTNYTIVRFYFANVNDSVSIGDIANITAYTTNNYTIYVNASDDDLLVPDKSVFNEILNFSSNDSRVTIISTSYISGTNKTQAAIFVNPNLFPAPGNYTINISVKDANNFSVAYDLFTIEVITNFPPVWDPSTQTTQIPIEESAFSLNLSLNVSDADGDAITFSYSSNHFPSFDIGASTGFISFTPDDGDVGYHNVVINASDGKVATPLPFNFTIYNKNDNPSIQTFPAELINASNDETNITADEDNLTIIGIDVDDNDFIIPTLQKSFYRENLTVNLTIQGPNTNLFNFSLDTSVWSSPDGPQSLNPQRLRYRAVFTPAKEDVGMYNVTVNFTDNSNVSTAISFTINVVPVSHNPILSAIGNQEVAYFDNFYFDVDSTDKEDINENTPGSNLTYFIENLTAGGDFLTINETTGIMNFTFDESYIGVWTFNVSVNDSDGLWDYEIFNISVYDYPQILYPDSNFEYNFKENVTANLNFSANHTVGNNLNYTLIINDIIRNSTIGYGNGTNFYWNFTANFTDETTCSGLVSLTLNVSNGRLSNSTTWSLTINHTNYPLSFNGTIPNMSGGSPRTLNLSLYYFDLDASDSCVNQTVGFQETLINATNGTITVAITNWTNSTKPLTLFSATSDAEAEYYMTAFEYTSADYGEPLISNISSNNFSVEISVSQVPVPVPTPGGGGGGGASSTKTKVVSLRIIVPEPVSVKKKDKIIVPIGIVNDGEIDLAGITLSAFVAKNGILRDDLKATFDRSFIATLPIGARENVMMIVDIDALDTGIFEVNINADVTEPIYNDSTKFYIEVTEEEDIKERIVFVEEFIVRNPECAELKELVDEAKALAEQNKFAEAKKKTDEIIEACQKAIRQPISSKVLRRVSDNVFGIVGIVSLLAFAFGIAFYYYKRIRLKKEMLEYKNRIEQGIQERI